MRAVAAICVFLLSSASLFAQEYRATLLGAVVDASGAAVPRAEIRAIDQASFPNTSPSSPLFGVVPLTQMNVPRSIELALRCSF